MNAIIGTIAVLLLAVVGYVFLLPAGTNPEPLPQDLGTYHYECDGFTFAMIPATDVATLTLVPAPGAPFFRVVLSRVGDDGRRFEGAGISLVGSGEAVSITSDAGSYACRPLPSSENAPWNWGDGEEGTRRDLAATTRASIVGMWQSVDDPRFTRVFEADGSAADLYESEPSARGRWSVFTDASAVSAPFPLEANTAYVSMTMSDVGDEPLYFRVVALTPETMELIYMDRGGVLRFTRIAEAAGATLDLSGTNLSSVPQEVFSRRELIRLDLSDNALTGALPAEVRQLVSLQELDLSGNRFTGVPAEIGQLSRLTRLDLSDNPITGLPYELGNLSALTELDLRGTQYSKIDLDIIRAKIPQTTILTD